MTPFLLVAAIAGLVWGAVLLRHGDLLSGCLAVVLTGSCFGHAFFHQSVGPLPMTADRLLVAGLCIAYVIFWRLGHADPKRMSKADVAGILFLIVLTSSTLLHDWKLNDSQPLATLLFFYLMPFAVYWVARNSRLSENSTLGLFAFFTLFGLYLALTAFAETRQWWGLVFPRYIASPDHAEFFGRGRGPFLNPIGCGLFMSAGLFSAAMWWPRLDRIGRCILVGIMLVLLLGIYCTLTRSVWVGAAGGLALIVLVSIPRERRLPLIAAMTIAGVVVLAAKWNSFAAFKRDKDVSVAEMAESARLRPVLAAVAWRMFLDRPFQGVGFGQYKQHDLYYLQEQVGDLRLEKARPYVQHNVFLALLTETGAIGTGLWVLALLLWSWNAWQLWHNHHAPLSSRQHGLLALCVLIAYGANGMFHDVGIITMVNTLIFLMTGVSQGLALAEPSAAGGNRCTSRQPTDTLLQPPRHVAT